LCEVLGTIAGCVAQGCRMNKSRLHPRSYQLLLGVGA
jgi:hypothetical protein